MDNDFNTYLDFCNYYGFNKNNYRSLQTFYLRLDIEARNDESGLIDELEKGMITFNEYRAIRGL